MHKNWSALNQQKQRGIKPISKLITGPKIFTSASKRTYDVQPKKPEN